MIRFATYACGCRDEQENRETARRCPVHGEPCKNLLLATRETLALRWGHFPEIPTGGLFYPAIDGMKGFAI